MKEFFADVKSSFKTLKWYEWGMAIIMVAIAAYSMVAAFISPTAGGNPAWLTVINFVSAVCGVVCIFFCAKANIGNFLFGIINTIVYIIYLAYWRIYGTMCLEIFLYLPFNAAGWFIWTRHRDEKDTRLTKSKRLNWWQNLVSVAVVGVGTIIYHEILVRVGGNVAWLDAATVAIGIVATALQMLRYREQYVWWLVTDVVAVAMYIQHFDAVYLTKKSIYLVMAVVGLYNWWKLNKTANIENE